MSQKHMTPMNIPGRQQDKVQGRTSTYVGAGRWTSVCSSSWNARLAGEIAGGLDGGSGRMAHISPAQLKSRLSVPHAPVHS